MLLFILGLASSIPLSVLANVLTPKIQDHLAKISVTRVGKRIATLNTEYDSIKAFVDDRPKLHLHVARVLTSIITSILLMSALAAVLISLQWTPPFSRVAHGSSELVPTLGGFVIAVLVYMLLIGDMVTILKLRRLLVRVDKFTEYEGAVFARIAKLTNEESPAATSEVA